MEHRNASDNTLVSAETLPQDSAALPEKEQGWAVRVQEETAEKPKERSFLARLIPESRKGKIVFANAVAQAASMTVAPLCVLLVEKFSEKQVNGIKDFVAGILARHMDRIEPVIRRPWEASMAPENLPGWRSGNNEQRGKHLGGVLTEMGFQGTFNIGVTVATRMLMDRVLGINAGGKAVVQTQMLDTAVAMGALVGLPAAFPTQSRNARLALRDWLETKEGFKKITGPHGPRQYALNTVNFALPDMLGFTAGTLNMLRIVEERELKALQQAGLQELRR